MGRRHRYADYWCLTTDNKWDKCDPSDVDCPFSDGKCMGTGYNGTRGQCSFDKYPDCNYWRDRGNADYWCWTTDNQWDFCDEKDVDCPISDGKCNGSMFDVDCAYYMKLNGWWLI